MARTTGTVKWFSQEKGYGFLTQPGGPDVFVHHSTIEGTGFKVLYEGEEVEFDVLQADKGLKAQNVVRLNPPAEAPRRGGGMGGGAPRREGAGRAGAGRYSDRRYDEY
jgi:CspA family cold shock protein